MFTKLTPKTKIMVGFILATIMINFIIMLNYVSMKKISSNLQEFEDISSGINKIQGVNQWLNSSMILELELINKDIIISNSLEKIYKDTLNLRNLSELRCNEFALLIRSDEEKAFWQEFISARKEWIGLFDKLFNTLQDRNQLLTSGITDKDEQLKNLDKTIIDNHLLYKKSFTVLQNLLNNIIKLKNQQADELRKDGFTILTVSTKMQLIVGIISITIVVMFGIFISQDINRILQEYNR